MKTSIEGEEELFLFPHATNLVWFRFYSDQEHMKLRVTIHTDDGLIDYVGGAGNEGYPLVAPFLGREATEETRRAVYATLMMNETEP